MALEKNTLNPPIAPPALNGSALPPDLAIELARAQLDLYKAQLSDRAEKQAAQEKARQELENARRQTLKTIEAEDAKNIANQASCSHMKERNMGTAVVGMGHWHSHTPIYMCQNCMKVWDETRPAAYLIPNSELVGRPQV